MADKIYRRTTQPSPILKSDAGKKARKRNVILNFRVTEQEKGLIEKRIELSGLKKSDYFIESCLYQKILVKGNIRRCFERIRRRGFFRRVIWRRCNCCENDT